MDPLPIWYKPFEENIVDLEEFPLHAADPTARCHVPFMGVAKRPGYGKFTAPTRFMFRVKFLLNTGFKDGDWAWLTSRHGKIKVPVVKMDALNAKTVWTWNAIGKRSGAWALDEKAPETQKGFLLNHLISELLPPKEDGMRWSNSDPITGQAAWFDLRVKIERADGGDQLSQPRTKPQNSPVGQGPKDVSYGEEF